MSQRPERSNKFVCNQINLEHSWEQWPKFCPTTNGEVLYLSLASSGFDDSQKIPQPSKTGKRMSVHPEAGLEAAAITRAFSRRISCQKVRTSRTRCRPDCLMIHINRIDWTSVRPGFRNKWAIAVPRGLWDPHREGPCAQRVSWECLLRRCCHGR